jgi:predicted DNA-binding transcriptional regulator AlpA
VSPSPSFNPRMRRFRVRFAMSRNSEMDESFTIQEFCAAEKISRAFFYKLQSQGKAPLTYPLGSNRRISLEAYLAWRTARESEAA